VIAVNNHAFGKARTLEGHADCLRVLAQDWKEKDMTAETMLAMKHMATVAYFCVPADEVRAMRFGIQGRVGVHSRRYNHLRESAPRLAR
jgi:hypothetical protein